MPRLAQVRGPSGSGLAIPLLFLTSGFMPAEQLPIKPYTTAEGLALTYLDMQGYTHTVWEQKGNPNGIKGQSIWGIPSRDGRHLAINGWAQNSNAWMIEGF